jgi:hypothetical protein
MGQLGGPFGHAIPINRPLGIPPGRGYRAFITLFIMPPRPSHLSFSRTCTSTFSLFHDVRNQEALGYLIPIFGTHCGLSSKTTLIMPSRRQSQHLHLDKGLPQTSIQNQSMAHLPTQTVSTTVKGCKHPTFNDIPECHQHQPATMSTTTSGSSQNGRDTSATQTNGGDP